MNAPYSILISLLLYSIAAAQGTWSPATPPLADHPDEVHYRQHGKYPQKSPVERIDGNAQFKPSPHYYLVVAFPDDYKTDQLSQEWMNGFRTNPTLTELRKQTSVKTYAASDPDWKHRWGNPERPVISNSELPAIVLMHGDQLVYKRSRIDSQTIASELKRGRFLDRLFQPRPDCPDCVRPVGPNRPYQPTPNQPGPDSPLRPINPPIPDTPVVPIPETPAIPDTPPPGPSEAEKTIEELKVVIAELLDRIEELENRPPPKDGKDGTDGKDGADGEDAVVDYDSIHQWIVDNKAELFPVPKIDDIIAQLPPIRFERLDGTDVVIDGLDVRLGQRLALPATTVNYQNDAGEILDTEYVPVGGTLTLHIDVLQK